MFLLYRGKAATWLALAAAAALAVMGCLRVAEAIQGRALHRYIHAAWWLPSSAPPLDEVIRRAPGRADGRAWSAYGQVLLAKADRARTAVERDRVLGEADAVTRKALRLSPGQAATWARLALIAVNRSDPDLAVAALRQSLVLAPNAPRLAWPRAKLGLYLWDRLGEAARAGVATDIRRVSRQPPSAALPYPRTALLRFAESIGRTELAAELAGRSTHAG